MIAGIVCFSKFSPSITNYNKYNNANHFWGYFSLYRRLCLRKLLHTLQKGKRVGLGKFWIVGGIFSWLIVPPLAAWLTIPHFADIIRAVWVT
jgi:hypothetical protein